MSGHSKWANIKRKKGAEDARRGKIFTRLARDIAMAAREGSSGDPATNAKLKIAVDKAKAENMPKDNIERAIARGMGKGDEGEEMVETTYEGYGPDGVAFLVDTLSENKNRTLAELKRVFNKAGGSLASAGSVQWQFDQKGVIVLGGSAHDFDTVFMIAAEAGADDVIDEDGTITVLTPREALGAVEEALRSQGYTIQEAALKWEAKNETDIPVDRALVNMKLMNDLEELDDVQSVASTLLITDDIIAAFETA